MSNEPQTSLPLAIANGMAKAAGEIEGSPVYKVVSFDRETRTAELQPVVTRAGVEQSNLTNVPVIFPPFMASDIGVGTTGHLLTAALNWKRWWRTGEIGPPEDNARHEAACGAFLPSLQSAPGTVVNIEANSTHVLRPDTGGDVKLGTFDATKAAVHEDLLADMRTMYNLFVTWITFVDGVIGPDPSSVNLATNLQTMAIKLNLSNYKSPSVKVEHT